MSQQIINQVSAGDTLGDPIFTAFGKVNANFTELYGRLPGISVLTYGADPTGVLDSTAAINQAMLVLSLLGGGVVNYPAGTFLVGVTTAISYTYSNIYHLGVSRESTVIVNAKANAPAFTVGDGVASLFGGGFSSMRFTGKSGVVGVAGQSAFLIQKAGQFKIQDVFASNATAALYRGAHLINCSQFVVSNLQVQACLNDGITNIGGVDGSFTDCRSDANGGAGWNLNASQGGYYKACTAFNNTNSAWFLVSGSPASAPNKNNFFVECVGDTSGTYNWQISDSQDSVWLGCWGSTQQSITVNTFATGFIVSTQNSKRLTFIGCLAITNNSHGFQLQDTGASAPVQIIIDGCQFTSNGVAAGGGYGIQLNGNVNNVRINSGNLSANATGGILNQSAQTDIVVSGNPIGFVANNEGSGVVTTTTTSIAVTHGLGFTPNLSNIQVTATSSMAASAITSYWISTPTATQFTVNTNAAVTGASFNFVWRAGFHGT